MSVGASLGDSRTRANIDAYDLENDYTLQILYFFTISKIDLEITLLLR